MLNIKITKTTSPKAKPTDESKLGFGKSFTDHMFIMCDLCDEKRYSAHKATARHRYAQTAKGRPLKIGNDRAYAEYLEKKMLGGGDKRKRFSPAAALAQAQKDGFETTICVSTLYSYITKKVFLHLRNRDLIEKSKRKKIGYHPVRRIAHPDLPSITNRPDYINSREEPGHWEMDLVVSCASGKGAILTLTERTGRQEIICPIPNKKAETVRSVLDQIERTTPNFREVFKSITTDNGSEFLKYEDLRRSVHETYSSAMGVTLLGKTKDKFVSYGTLVQV